MSERRLCPWCLGSRRTTQNIAGWIRRRICELCKGEGRIDAVPLRERV